MSEMAPLDAGFDLSIPVSVKRQVEPERGAATTGRVSSSSRRTRTRLGTGTRWTAGAGRPALARRSTHNRAECLGARLGITDGTDRSRAREQFLHFVCR